MRDQAAYNPRVAAMPKHARARYLKDVARYKAGRNKPPTREQAKAWLDPIRNALAEIRTGEIDTYRGYAITRIHWKDEDFARVDFAINGFLALIERLMPDMDTGCMKRVSKKLTNGILLEVSEVDECSRLLRTVENRLLDFTRAELIDAANTEMTIIELERLGIKEAA